MYIISTLKGPNAPVLDDLKAGGKIADTTFGWSDYDEAFSPLTVNIAEGFISRSPKDFGVATDLDITRWLVKNPEHLVLWLMLRLSERLEAVHDRLSAVEDYLEARN